MRENCNVMVMRFQNPSSIHVEAIHKPLPNTFFHLEQLSFVKFWCSRIQGHIQLHYFMLKAPSESMCVCSNSLKLLGQLKPNYMWHHHGIGEKMESLLSRGAEASSRDFTTNLATQQDFEN